MELQLFRAGFLSFAFKLVVRRTFFLYCKYFGVLLGRILIALFLLKFYFGYLGIYGSRGIRLSRIDFVVLFVGCTRVG